MRKSLTPLFCCLLVLSASAVFGGDLKLLLEANIAPDNALKNVLYTVYQEDQIMFKDLSKNGKLKLSLEPSSKTYYVLAEYPGMVNKEIQVRTSDYPEKVRKEYIILVFDPIAKNSLETEAVKLIYSPETRDTKLLSTEPKFKSFKDGFITASQTLSEVKTLALKNAANMWEFEEYAAAKGFYEIILKIDPKHSVAQERLAQVDKLIAEKQSSIQAEREAFKRQIEQLKDSLAQLPKQLTEPLIEPDENISSEKPNDGHYFSVQVGAFHDWFNASAFTELSDLIVAQGSDYKRCLAGSHNTRTAAMARLEQVKTLGFEDAFIVEMSGDERVGF